MPSLDTNAHQRRFCYASFSAVVLMLGSMLMTACATKSYIKEETGAQQARLDQLQGQLEQLATRNAQLLQQTAHLEQISTEALQRAKESAAALQQVQEAGRHAEGKFLYETVLSFDKIRFAKNNARLTSEAMAGIDELVRSLSIADFYIEIQGHGEPTERSADSLALKRADAVRFYLNSHHNLPLQRLNCISYGSGAPIANNRTEAGRAQNRRVALVILSAGEAVRGAQQYPLFPWPPPTASGTEVVSRNLLMSRSGTTSLSDVDSRIRTALEAGGYFGSSYFAVPGGFALVTQMEQINADGTPKPSSERWLPMDARPKTDFTLSAYLRALFVARPGHYRVIVFVVTPLAFSQASVSIAPDEPARWLEAGLNRLPSAIGAMAFSPANYSCTALIYEFQRQSESDSATLQVPGVIPARIHLQKAGVWSALSHGE